MKYFLTLYVTFNDGTAGKKAIYDCASADKAIAEFHKYLGQYVGQANVASVMCVAMNTYGGIIKNEAWVAPTPTVEVAE